MDPHALVTYLQVQLAGTSVQAAQSLNVQVSWHVGLRGTFSIFP